MPVAIPGPSFQPLGPTAPTIPLPAQPLATASQQQGQKVADQTLHQPPGPGYQPPAAPMGGTNKVVQQPMPQGFSALGGIGVMEKVEQRPMAQDTIIAPGNQSVVPVGGIAEVVQEKITH